MLSSLAAALLLAVPAEARPVPLVRVGLERVEADGGKPLVGQRLGLVAHAASVTADGRHAAAVLKGLGLDVRRLFAPEHGLLGMAAAGEKVPNAVDSVTRLPVVSLYGDRKKPAPEDLKDLDALVIDLQDAGVRFYTYASTMLLCLEAAADAGIEVVVLDRPNPLGGELVEGPLADPAAVAPGLLNMAPGPLVHGLTLGEMASFVNARRAKPARLTVVRMDGWTRAMRWRDTGRPWVNPSPSLRSPEAALAYPGTCLLEATNVSEGRGTESPFLTIGSPWLKADAVHQRLNEAIPTGFQAEPLRFTPRASPAATEPKYDGIACAGLRIAPRPSTPLRPYLFGLVLLESLRAVAPEFRLLRDGAALDRLLGTRRVREAFDRNDLPQAIADRDRANVEAFLRDRQPTLLY